MRKNLYANKDKSMNEKDKKLIQDLTKQFDYNFKRKRNTELPRECGEVAFKAMRIAFARKLAEQKKSGNADMNDLFPEER